MATNGRFDLSLHTPDGPTYASGQRGTYAAAPLEKPGCFREGSDRILSSPTAILKSSATSSQGDMTCLLQSLASDLKVIMADQKLHRPGEMKQAMSSVFGASPEDSSAVFFGTKKPLNYSSLEMIKRLMNILQESLTITRARKNILCDALVKIDKFSHSITRKRSRVDSSSGERLTGIYQGGSIPKTGFQSHLSGCGLELGSQSLEEKAKIGVPNRKIRTSLVEMDAQANCTARTSGSLEKDKDMLKLMNRNGAHVAENDCSFSSVADAWGRPKMKKKKRSVIKSEALASSGLVRSLGGNQETKRGMQQKLGSDARRRLNSAHSFRRGSDNSTTMVGKSDSRPQQIGPSISFRNEQNNVSPTNDKRDVQFCPDIESASLRVITKPNIREDSCAASPALLKHGSARGPRSNSGSLSKTSNIYRLVENPEDMEPPQTTDKFCAVGVINRKRLASVRSSSTPVGHSVVQRTQRNFRSSSRRSSLSPIVSSQDELSISDIVDEAPINHNGLSVTGDASSISSLHNRLREGNFLSASLSESEESGVQENRLKNKVKKHTDMEDKLGQTVQKFVNLIMPSRKNRLAIDEDSGDGDRRLGTVGRGLPSARTGMSAIAEKFSEAVTTKQQRSMRHGSERAGSKPGCPHIKFSDNKSHPHPRKSINILSLESSEESADHHEELVASAIAALDTGRGCSSSFWKQLEPVFSFVSTEDMSFLDEQIQLTNESAARTNNAVVDSQNLKVHRGNVSMSSAPVVTNRYESITLCDRINFYECEKETGFTKEAVYADPFSEPFMVESGSHNGVSIFQALLSAIIGEDDVEKFYNTIDYGESYPYNDSHAAHFVLGKDLKTKSLNLQLLDDSQSAGTASDSYKFDTHWRSCDEISHERLGTNGILEPNNIPLSKFDQVLRNLVSDQTEPLSRGCPEFEYNQMSIHARLMLELSEIGLYPEPVPDLKYGEDEDITEGIHILEEKLNEQVANRKNLLLKLKKAVMDAKELQQRKLERLAMNNLVQMAYERFVACWGPSASGNKSAKKLAKHAALALVKRTLARCQKFDETRINCFSESVFRCIFLSASSGSSKSQIMDIPVDDCNCNPVMFSQVARKMNTHTKFSNPAQSVHQPQGQSIISIGGPWSDQVKTKDAFLDDVVDSTAGSSLRTPGLGSSFASGAKGKRSERDRDGKGHNRDPVFKNGTAKVSRPGTSSTKGERKNKTKPKLKATHLSSSVNVHAERVEMSGTASSVSTKSSGWVGWDVKEKDHSSSLPGAGVKKLSNDSDAIDLSNLQIPDMDVTDFGVQGQDLGSWLNFEEEGLQDHDNCMGLEIPMDDLSEVHLMI